MTSETLLSFLGAVLLVVSLLLGLRQLTAPWREKVKNTRVWLDKFMRDWSGEEAEEGRDSVPGVMERLNKLDGELSNNGGKSLKDTVEKTEKAVKELDNKMSNLDKRLEGIEKAIVNSTRNTPPSSLV